MRSVYSSFLVHTYISDIFTDLLIIIEWLNLDPQKMAYNAIGILIVHKIISVAGFWSKERNIYRCLLQLFDLVAVQEIYVCHLNIIKQYTQYKQYKTNNPNTSKKIKREKNT